MDERRSPRLPARRGGAARRRSACASTCRTRSCSCSAASCSASSPGCRCRSSTRTWCSSRSCRRCCTRRRSRRRRTSCAPTSCRSAVLAIGLVLVTVVAVAAVAHWSAGLPWAAAFILGAVLGPTDPVSATAIVRRARRAAADRDGARGRGAGQRRHRPDRVQDRDRRGRRDDPVGVRRGRANSCSSRPAAWRSASWSDGCSPICGSPGASRRSTSCSPSSRRSPPTCRPRRSASPACSRSSRPGVYVGRARSSSPLRAARLRTLAFWQASEFMLNSLLFLLIGLQVTRIVGDINGPGLGTLLAEAAAVAAVVIGIRLAVDVHRARAHAPRFVSAARSARAARASAGAACAAPCRSPRARDPDRGLPGARPGDLPRLRRGGAHAGRARAHARAADRARSASRRARSGAARRSRRACASPTRRSSGSTRWPSAASAETASSGCATTTRSRLDRLATG